MTHHASSIRQFDSCPAQYDLLRKNPGVVTGSVAMERGTAVHKAAEVYLDGVAAGKPDEQAVADARRAVEGLRTSLSAAAINEAEWFLKRLFGQAMPTKAPDEEWRTEFSFGFDAEWNLGGDRYHGRMDFLRYSLQTGIAIVRDFKTSRQVEPLSELRTNLQLLGYAFAAAAVVQEGGAVCQSVTVERHYTAVAAIQRYTLTPEELAAVPSMLDGRIAAIEATTVFLPKPEPGLCANCAVRYLCPAYKAADMERVEVKSAEDAARLWGKVGLWETLAEDGKDRVKAWIAANGAVGIGGGKRLDLVPIQKRVVKSDALNVLRETRGIDADQILRFASITVGNLEKLLAGDESAMAECVDVVSESRLTKVSK